jgi:hypothetical protein
MTILRTLIATASWLLLAGCVTSQPRYFAPGKTEQDLLKARMQCFAELQKNPALVRKGDARADKPALPGCGALNACLATRGFLKAEEGNVELPKGATLQCEDPE